MQVPGMVIMASPRRRLVVQAVFGSGRLARRDLADYGVASRAKVVALASDWTRRAPHGRARGKAEGAVRARGKSRGHDARAGKGAHRPPARAHPSLQRAKSREWEGKRGERGREEGGGRQQHLESGCAPPPSSHPLLLPRRRFEAPAAPRPPTSAPIGPPPICPSDWTSAYLPLRLDLRSAGSPLRLDLRLLRLDLRSVDSHLRPLPPSIRGCFLCSASLLSSFTSGHSHKNSRRKEKSGHQEEGCILQGTRTIGRWEDACHMSSKTCSNKVCLCHSILVKVCVWRRLAARHTRLGVWKGVGRHASPYRRKNHGARIAHDMYIDLQASGRIENVNQVITCRK